jgi:hypothetical protein
LVSTRRKAASLVLRASFSSAVNCSRDVSTDDLLNKLSEKGLNLLSDLTSASRPAGKQRTTGSSQPSVLKKQPEGGCGCCCCCCRAAAAVMLLALGRARSRQGA